jgi:Secretion system C-terminal sorting domain
MKQRPLFLAIAFLLFLFPSLKAQNVPCSSNTIPKYHLIILAIDSSYLAEFNGDLVAARAFARERAEAGVLNLSTMFTNWNVTFKIVHFPIEVFAVPNFSNKTLAASNVSQLMRNKFSCIPFDAVMFFSPSLPGSGFGSGSVAFFSPFNPSPVLIAHEVGHTLGFKHTELTACDYECDSALTFTQKNFMCGDYGDNTTFTVCQSSFLINESFPNRCNNWKQNYEPVDSAFTCPILPADRPIVNLSSDIRYLTTECLAKDKPTFTITVSGSPDTTSVVRLRANYFDTKYDINLSTQGIDFNTQVNGASTQAKQLRILQNPTDPNSPEAQISIAPGEIRTFQFQLTYNPDVPTNQSDQGSLMVEVEMVIDSPSFFVSTRKGQIRPLAYIPVNGVLNLMSSNPVIVENELVVQNNDLPWNAPAALMKSGSRIIVKNNGSIMPSPVSNMNMPIIEGCDAMWQGVILDNSTSSLTLKNVTIKDAQTAITVTKGATLSLNNARFDNNNIGILFKPGAGSSNIYLNDVVFDFTATAFKPSYSPNQNPFPGTKSFAGMIVSDEPAVVLTTSNTMGVGSSFRNQKWGIRAFNSNLLLDRTGFFNISESFSRAIYAENSQINVDNSAFDNCRMGVEAINGSTGVTNSTMTLMGAGINALASNQLKISGNIINAKDYGISFYHNNPIYGNCAITQNFITVEGNPNAFGISTGGTQLMPPTNGGGLIASNNIKVNDGNVGVQVLDVNRIEVDNNTINLTTTLPNKYGVRVENGDRTTISNNTVTGATTAETNAQRGIFALNTCRSLVTCNSTHNMAYGINFAGDCTSKGKVNLVSNTMMDHTNGLLMGLPPANGNAIIGAQAHRQNQWVGSYGGFGARHLGGQNIAVFSLFVTDDNFNPSFMPNFIDPPLWFVNQQGDGSTILCSNTEGLAPNNQVEDERIANGEVQGSADGGLMQWLAQRRLRERLNEDGNTWPNSSIVSGFLNQNTSNGVGAYAQIPVGIRQAYVVSSSQQSTLNNYEADINVQTRSIRDLQRQLADPLLPITQRQALEAQKATLQASVATQLQNRTNLLQTIVSNRTTALGNVATQNSGLCGSDVFQTNAQTVNTLWLNTVGAGATTLTEAQIGQLRPIAMQCPLTGGDGVSRARLLLQMYSTTPIPYHDDAACATEPREESAQNVVSSSQNWAKAVPNPANDQVTMMYQIDEPTTLTVQDALGRVIFSQKIYPEQSSLRLDTQSWSSGTYIYQLTGCAAGKIIINH